MRATENQCVDGSNRKSLMLLELNQCMGIEMHTHEGDDALFQMFNQLGMDLKKKREVDFNFVFSEEENAVRAKVVLAKNGFETNHYEIPQPWWKRLFAKSDWGMTASRELALDKQAIKTLTTKLQKTALKFNGVYDGWGTSVADEQLDF